MTVQIRNGPDNGFQRAELVLRRTYHDSENKEQTLEEITWRAGYDQEGRTPGPGDLPQLRGRGPGRQAARRQPGGVGEAVSPFVPICRGVTFFQIQACKGEELLDQWPASAPPPGVKITISFGEPHETVRGAFDVDEQTRSAGRWPSIRRGRSSLPSPAGADAERRHRTRTPRRPRRHVATKGPSTQDSRHRKNKTDHRAQTNERTPDTNTVQITDGATGG